MQKKLCKTSGANIENKRSEIERFSMLNKRMISLFNVQSITQQQSLKLTASNVMLSVSSSVVCTTQSLYRLY